jgi:FG-GAP repeat protein
MFKPSLSCRPFLCAIITLPVLLTPMASGQTMLSAVGRFVADDGITGNAFARSIDFDGTLAVVGAYFDDATATNAGSAYVFDVETGDQLYQLVAFDGAANDWFGKAVAISGNLVAIGAEQNDQGAVYVYEADTGVLIQRIVPEDSTSNNRFGYSVCFSDQFLIVGAYGDAGSVYIYDREELFLVTKVIGNDTQAGDHFGAGVAAHAQVLAVGATGTDENGPDSGAVYTFDLETMIQTNKLVPADVGAGEKAGESVAVWDGIVALGVPKHGLNGEDSGAVYLFETQTGGQLSKFVSTDIGAGDQFGASVSIEADVVVIGAMEYDFDMSPYTELNAGTAYIFDVQSGQQLARLVPGQIVGSGEDRFGSSALIQDGRILVGAMNSNDIGNESGAIYRFSIEGIRFSETTYFPSDPGFVDHFGHSVAVDGRYMVVGAPVNGDGGGPRSGAAYIFDMTTGQMIRKVYNQQSSFNNRFGRSVAIDDGIVAVGAPVDSSSGFINAGSVSLFDAETGNLIRRLHADDPGVGDLFGHSVGIHNGIVVVGAFAEDDNGSSAGAAYTFDAKTGEQLAKLLADDGRANDRLGWSVAIEDGIAVVGAIFSRVQVNNAGAAYVFDAHSGEQLFKLSAEDRGPFDYFGHALAIRSGVVAVGAPKEHSGVVGSGSVYLFDVSLGVQMAKVSALDPVVDAQFGWSVALNTKQLVAGIRRPELPTVSPDKAYVFDLATLEQLVVLLPTDGTLGDRFGTAVAVSNEVIGVGASNEYEQSDDSGTAYTFSTGLMFCDADINFDGAVDFGDVSLFIELLAGRDPDGDFNGDGRYNYFDISAFLGAYSNGCS